VCTFLVKYIIDLKISDSIFNGISLNNYSTCEDGGIS